MIVRPKRIYRKRIPYGMQNFEDVIKEDCYYVDKTPFIEQIEESNKYFFFIRPRRFGKTLTLSMLENYYDINKKDKFDEIFGKLYIGENPTPEHNSYLIIHLNFAIIAPSAFQHIIEVVAALFSVAVTSVIVVFST